ncbi:MAG TPA: tryptophan synthase subunit alpha [Candidatus Acidoferrales bacterium]|nr:tryptophan synthase subunit alpha [Candidatus Acidoferrales bacterium]
MSELALKADRTQQTRIGRRFKDLARTGELGLVAYVTAGDPSLEATEKIVLAAVDAGADIIELGVPFSDPVADGPTIQRASERALRCGTTLTGVIDLVAALRKKTDVAIVLFSYFNPILQMGLEKFALRASAAGADGVLVTDMTPEEAGEHCAIMRSRGLDTIFLAAPTSTDERLKLIVSASTGFLYIVSRNGVTGAKESLPEELPAMVRRARKFTSLPIAVGFGISLPTQVTVLGGIADAVAVGSALVAEIENATSASAAATAVAERIRLLKSAARRGVSRRDANP